MSVAAVFLPLLGAIIAGFFGRWIGDRGAQLVTCLAMLGSAAADADRRVRILEMRGQSQDHPVLLNVPETAYLKCIILEVID